MIHVTKENYQEVVLNSNKKVLIDFWAQWCGPCRMIAPELEKVEVAVAGEVVICKVNIDEEPEIASAFQVKSIPTLAVVEGENLTKMAVGFRKSEDILEMLGY